MPAVLDVEDAEQRLDRLQNAFQRLNDTTTCKPTPNLSFLSENTRSKPQFIPPPTDLLSRVQAFLPALEASNALLASQDPTHIDIEHIDSTSRPYIEMNLGLGLFDVRGSTSAFNVDIPNAHAPMPMFPLSRSPSASSDSSAATPVLSSSSDDWDSDEDSDDVEIITSFKPLRPIRPLPRRVARQMQAQVRPGIVVLGEPDCGARNGEEG